MPLSARFHIPTGRRAAAFVLTIAALLAVGIRPEREALAETSGVASETVPVSPFRILDTRQGIGTSGLVGQLGADRTISLQVAGVGSVPSTATGVVLNLTASNASAAGYITAWPNGQTRPEASVLNLNPGQDLPNMITATLGDGGKLNLYNSAGNVDLIADVAAYLLPAGTSAGATGPQGPQGPAGPPGPAGPVAAYTGRDDTNRTIDADGTNLANMALPAGSYVVTALIGVSDGTYDISCGLGGNFLGQNTSVILSDTDSPAFGTTYEFSKAGTSAIAGNIVLSCFWHTGGNVLVDWVQLTAVQVSTLTAVNIAPS